LKDGLVVKMERMLVRVDKAGSDVPDDFDENGDQKIDSRVKDKWREYMVVCRQSISEEADFVLQFYKTRVCGYVGTLLVRSNASRSFRRSSPKVAPRKLLSKLSSIQRRPMSTSTRR
jgi:hypothetical protein